MLIVHLDGVQPLDKRLGGPKLLLKHETCYQYKCSVKWQQQDLLSHSDLNEIPEEKLDNSLHWIKSHIFVQKLNFDKISQID